MENSIKQIDEIINNTFQGITLFVRDLDLKEKLANKYKKNLVIREKGYVDVSFMIGGMVTTHRYCILSNHIYDISQIAKDAAIGHCLAKRDGHFKVLDVVNRNNKTFIILLHLPDDNTWKVFNKVNANLEEKLVVKALEVLEKTCEDEPIEAFSNDEWLQRCSLPLGISDDGKLFELE